MIQEENKETPHSKILMVMWKVLSNLAFVLPILFAFSLQRVFAIFPSFVEFVYSRKIYRFISIPVSFITSLAPFSLTEMLLYLSVPAFIVLIVLFVLQIRKSKNRRKTLLKDMKKVGWTISILYVSFMLLLGFNYARMPLSSTLEITTSPRSKEDLESVCAILLEKTNESRIECIETDGVMTLEKGISDALENACQGYNAVSEVYPVLEGSARRAKGVLASKWWSYTGISGMYFPFFVEANVNIDIPEMFIPTTILHELAHTAGIAREDEAGFVAFLTGIHHPNHDFQYSSYLYAYIEASNALYSVDKEAYKNLQNKISDAVMRDIRANSAYWQQFEGPVQSISTSVNNAYLQSNMQEDGVQSYGAVVDLIIGYYLS